MLTVKLSEADIKRISKMSREEVTRHLRMCSEDVRRMGLESARSLLASVAEVA